MNSPLLTMTDLSVSIDTGDRTVRALDRVGLRVGAHESLGIVGESGSGKTMASLALMRQLPVGGRITGGSILLRGQELTSASDADYRGIRGDRIGMIFQDPLNSLNPTMTIGAQVAEPFRIHRKLPRAAAWAAAIDALGDVGLPRPEERAKQYPHQLSGGMRQRVMIAIALACRPSLLVADEPTTALDVTIQRQILDLIQERLRATDMSVMLITHDLGVIAGRTDRVAVMYAGRIIETGSTVDVMARPAHPYTRALLEATPERAVDLDAPLKAIPGSPPDLSRPLAGCRFAPRCAFATDRCREEEPELVTVAPGQQAACHFPFVSRPDADAPATGPIAVATDPGAAADVCAPALLQLDAVSKRYALSGSAFGRSGTVSALEDVSLRVENGTTLGIVGESGCGKSTLGRIIVGLEEPTAGRVLVDGTGYRDRRGGSARAVRRDVQLMFQDSSAALDPRMRIGDVLEEPLILQHAGARRERAARVAELLDDVGLPADAVDRYPHEFSGGQRQRIGLARALALSPRLLVADEPASALDVSVQAQILNLMRSVQRKYGTSYVVISHDLSVVRYISDRIAVMYLGALVEIGPAEAVAGAPAHPYSSGLIAAGPHLAGQEREAIVISGELPSAADPPSGCRFRTRCPLAQEVCATQVPPLRPTTVPGRSVACHFPLDGTL